LGFVLRPLSWTRFFITNANPACSCVYICKFQFRPIHPPSRRLSTPTRAVAIVCPRGHFTSCVHHHFRRHRTSCSSSRPLSCSSSPTCCPHSRSQPRATDARRRGYGASRSCSWTFSVRAVEEDMVARGTCHA
jgi:hypothetical protein